MGTSKIGDKSTESTFKVISPFSSSFSPPVKRAERYFCIRSGEAWRALTSSLSCKMNTQWKFKLSWMSQNRYWTFSSKILMKARAACTAKFKTWAKHRIQLSSSNGTGLSLVLEAKWTVNVLFELALSVVTQKTYVYSNSVNKYE